ncbi:glycosyltransferase family 4 protein [Flavobacterium sp. KACC 22763]|uniref:glycosyltransferase family 4 protein n=1 Tax=Flavobacterium sp. KACC 22763 TaxID=3025668 RepID=UPI002365FB6F|nr:glycosyltransferase family 1 protein [Flavobacterium sp. KACC 22763]WDF62892.1 glycosyltransferase family 1 protein [Flavobacterium sp. KACC 22763]
MNQSRTIGINLLYMNRRLSGGSITYGINLINELIKLDTINKYIIYVNKDCIDLPILTSPNFKIKVIPFYNKVVYVRYFWEQLLFPFYLLKDNLDLLHSLGYVGPVFCPTKHIVSILDLNYKRHAESMSYSKKVLLGSMVKLMSIFSNKIITISEFSKKEISEGLNVKGNKITVTHLSGSNDQYENRFDIDIKSLYNIKSDYIIAFGSPSSHKNIMGLILAFSDLQKKCSNVILILVGHQHNNKELQDYIISLDLKEKILFTGFVPDEHIFPLISASKLFVFPSFYEGFGIPLLDAQSTGTPVACSIAASLPEVGNDGALYFNPNNTSEMEAVMLKILKDDSVREDLIKKGLINRGGFSWKKTAEKTLECYNLNN